MSVSVMIDTIEKTLSSLSLVATRLCVILNDNPIFIKKNVQFLR